MIIMFVFFSWCDLKVVLSNTAYCPMSKWKNTKEFKSLFNGTMLKTIFPYHMYDVAKLGQVPTLWMATVTIPGVVNDPDAVLQKTDALGRVLRLCVAWSNEADDCWKLGWG